MGEEKKGGGQIAKVAQGLQEKMGIDSQTMIQHEKIRRKALKARIISVEQAVSLPQHVFEEFDRHAPLDEEAVLPNLQMEMTEEEHEVENDQATMSLDEIQADIQQAYDRGFSDGQAVTSALMESEIGKLREQAKNLDTLVLDLQEQFAREIEQFQTMAVNVAIVCAEHILQREVSVNARLAVEQARKVLVTMHGLRDVVIRVHPHSYEAMQEANLELLNSTNTLRSIEVQADPGVENGTCVLETSMGHIDTQLSTQLAHLRLTMNETVQVKELTEEF